MRHIKIDFEKKSKKGGLMIEGFANANTFDRANERIDPAGWKLDNYMKNPVILFDHGHDIAFGSLPIGQATEVIVQDDGLYIKAAIATSKTEKITAVRDLIEDGILRTFSVGFNPGVNAIEKTKEGIIIREAELIENSIVPVPMNQDSVFSVSQRSFKSALATDWFSKYAKVHELYKKGAKFAAIINDHIRKSGADYPTVMQLLKSAGINEQIAMNILDGQDLNLDAEQMELFAKALKFELTSYGVINMKSEENNEDKGCGEDKKPKEKEENPESTIPSPGLTEEEMMGAMEQMASEANACATDSEGNPPSWVADEGAWTKAKEAADKTYSREDAAKYYSVVTWLYLNRFGGTLKTGESSQDDASKGYTAESQKEALPTGDNAVPPDQNPYLDLAKQNNVLLSTMIMELQKVNQKLEMVIEKPQDDAKEENEVENSPDSSEDMEKEGDEVKKMIAKIEKAHDDLRKRIVRLQS